MAKFITVSYLLQAGIRAYHRPDYSSSLRLLGECVRARSQFPEINTRCVMLRYFGLAAAREGNTGCMQQAVELLNKEGANGVRHTSHVNPRADAEFILGMSCRLDERWGDAAKHFSRSLTGLKAGGHMRVSDCHRELAQCYLNPHSQIRGPDIPPDYSAARFHARQAYESRDTIMALDILVKVLTDSCWKDVTLSDVDKSELEGELAFYFEQLHSVSTNLGWGTWHQRKAEDLIQYGDDDSLEQALASAREAHAISSREEFQPLIWKILIKLGTETHLVELIQATSDAIDNNRFNARTRSVAARYLIAAHIQNNNIPTAQQVYDRYSSGFPRGVAKNVQVSIRVRDIENAIWLD